MDRPADTGPDEITDVQPELDRLPDDEPLVTTPGEARCQYLAAEWPGVPEPRWQCILPRLHEGEHRVIATPTVPTVRFEGGGPEGGPVCLSCECGHWQDLGEPVTFDELRTAHDAHLASHAPHGA